MFRWLGPKGLFFLAFDVVISGIFGKYSDKREIEGAMAAQDPPRLRGDDVWIDYIADIGDGWNATATMAWLLAQERLEIEAPHDGLVTERGAALIMGGDEVYPKASEEAYEQRVATAYRGALGGRHENRMLFAIPGNHDWYDGLTSFLRTFCQNERFAGWKTPQRRSYFSIQLPHRWWILGIDIAFDYYLDQGQLAYFDGLRCTKRHVLGREMHCDRVHPGDLIVLCTAKPGWEEAKINGDFRSVKQTVGRRALYEFEQGIVREWGCHLRLVLSGDLHHYAHYAPEAPGGTERITAGGGGAFFYPSHAAPDEVPWPSDRSDGPQQTLRLQRVFPEKSTSRSWWPAIIGAPIVANPTFALFAGLLYAALGLLVPGGVTDPKIGVAAFTPPHARPLFVILVLALLLVFHSFADARTWWGRWLVGIGHWGAQLAALLTSVVVGHRLAVGVMNAVHHGHSRADFVFFLTALAAVFVIGGLAGGLVMGLYLFVAQLFGRHPNEAYAALHLSRYKNFLRMHLDEGGLTIYPLGVSRICTRWEPRPNDAEGPYYAPSTPPVVEMIGPPIEIRP